jgi:hypothetical protein
MFKKIFFTLAIVNFLVLDIAVLYLFFKPQEIDSNQSLASEFAQTTSDFGTNDYCDSVCKDSILTEINDIKVKLEENSAPTYVSVSPTVAKSQAVSLPRTKVKSVSYVPIPGSGSTLNTAWTSIDGTDFYLDKTDFPGIKEIYFEANMKLFNGNGTANLRIFDVTHGVAVTGSEVTTSSQTSTYVSSSKLNVWNGWNHYVVQGKSLTSDTTVFESGKLKIITEN